MEVHREQLDILEDMRRFCFVTTLRIDPKRSLHEMHDRDLGLTG